MELFYSSLFLLIFLSLLLLLLLRFRCFGGKPHHHGKRLPPAPGPWKLPIIGHIQHLIIGSDLPHRSFRDLASKYGPLMLLKLGEVPTLVVSSPEAANEIMKSHDITFSSRPLTGAVKTFTYGGKDLIFSPYGDYWRQLRKICVLELLSLKRVQSFRSIREEEVTNLIRSISSSSSSSSTSTDYGASTSVNLSKMLFWMTNDITTRTVIGNKCKDHQSEFLAALTESIELAGGFNLADLFPSSSIVTLVISGMAQKTFRKCHKKVDQILDGIIREHKERRRRRRTKSTSESSTKEDLLDVLLRIQDEGGQLEFPLTMDSIKAVIFVSSRPGPEN